MRQPTKEVASLAQSKSYKNDICPITGTAVQIRTEFEQTFIWVAIEECNFTDVTSLKYIKSVTFLSAIV